MGAPQDPEPRFARAIRRGRPSDYAPQLGPCLLYLGASNGNGYGQFRYNDRNGYAHRYAWERVHGPIPNGLTVDHLCRVRNCVEVTHLELVDGPTNTRRGAASRDHCPNNHPYSPDNTGRRRTTRECRTCKSNTWRRSEQRRRSPVDTRVNYDQDVIRRVIRQVRQGEVRIAEAAREVGCNPNYLGRRAWEETRRDVLERDGLCVRCGLFDRQLDAHHRVPRGRGGSSLPLISFGMANLITLCRSCHEHVESHRSKAFHSGWLVHRGTDPAKAPVYYVNAWALLNNAGGLTPVPGEINDAEELF